MACNKTALYEKWDHEMASKDTDLEKVKQEMIAELNKCENGDVEILWRLSRVSYEQSLNYVEEQVIKVKTSEAYQYAEKAVRNNADNFQSNKWFAVAAGKMALLENDVKEKLRYLNTFLSHIKICSVQNPLDQMVLFMEGRLQLALSMLPDNEKKWIQEQLGVMPQIDLNDAVAKLKKSLELNPNFIDNYITLVYLYIKDNKIAEAREMIDKGLSIPRVTKSDEVIAKELEKLKQSLDSSGAAAPSN